MKMKRLDIQSAIHLSRVLSTFSAKIVDIQTLSDDERNEFIEDINEHLDDDTFDLKFLIGEMKSFIKAVEHSNSPKDSVQVSN